MNSKEDWNGGQGYGAGFGRERMGRDKPRNHSEGSQGSASWEHCWRYLVKSESSLHW